MTTFQIGFDGPGIREGEIDVGDLAPALLALGDLFESANAALNNAPTETKLKLRASERGCFVALLSLDVSFIADMLDVMSANPEKVTAAKDLIQIVIGGGTIVGGTTWGLFSVLRFLNGAKPETSTQNEDGTTSVTKGGTTIIVEHKTAKLLTDYSTREAAKNFVTKALQSPGITSVSLGDSDPRTDAEPTLVLTKDDIKAVQIPDSEVVDADETRSQREVWLQIVSAHFEDGYKWRFTDGTNTFTAMMLDRDFKSRLATADLALTKNDTLRCLIEDVQRLENSQLKTETFVLEVREHVSGAKQLRLFD